MIVPPTVHSSTHLVVTCIFSGQIVMRNHHGNSFDDAHIIPLIGGLNFSHVTGFGWLGRLKMYP